PDAPGNSHIRALCDAEQRAYYADLAAAQRALRECLTQTRLVTAEGYVDFLRVSEVGDVYGGGDPDRGGTNPIGANVVFRLRDTKFFDFSIAPKRAFGFELKDDSNRPAREGMLALLREAIAQNLKVKVDADELINPPNDNLIAVRIALVIEARSDLTFPADAGPGLARG